MTDARDIPDCPICDQQVCADPDECRRRMIPAVEHLKRAVRDAEALGEELREFAVSIEEFRRKYPNGWIEPADDDEATP